MIGFTTPKIKDEYHQTAVPLRLVVEAFQELSGCAVLVFRVSAPTKFEQGVHSTGLALDIKVPLTPVNVLERACIEVNKRFPVPGAAKQVCTLMADPSNLPNGKRLDTPHIHVQIPFDWKAEPRAFLEAHGFLEGLHKS